MDHPSLLTGHDKRAPPTFRRDLLVRSAFRIMRLVGQIGEHGSTRRMLQVGAIRESLLQDIAPLGAHNSSPKGVNTD